MEKPRPETPAGFDDDEQRAWHLMTSTRSIPSTVYCRLGADTRGALQRLARWNLVFACRAMYSIELSDLGRKWAASDG